MTIIYRIDKIKDEIQLFGEDKSKSNGSFVKNNKDNCYLLIEGNKHELYTQLTLSKNQKQKDI